MGFEFKVYTGKDEEFRTRMKDHKKKPHRCDDRVVDLCKCIVAGEPLQNLKQTWHVMWNCVTSQPGQEPTDPYVLVSPTDLCYKDHNKQHQQPFEQQYQQPFEQHQQQPFEQQHQQPFEQQHQQQAQQMQPEQQRQSKSWWRWEGHGS